MQPEHIRQLIETNLPQTQVHVEGDGAHFIAIVVSDVFLGKSRVQRQQLVYDTVRSQLLDGTLHALSIKTYTLDEWEKIEPAGEDKQNTEG